MTEPKFKEGQYVTVTDVATGKECTVIVRRYIGDIEPMGSSPFELRGHSYTVQEVNGPQLANFSEHNMKAAEVN